MLQECKILVLDDEKLVTSSLKSLFTIEGFKGAVFFNSPLLALDYLKENHCDVIISDFMMEEMNGIEFLSEAKKLNANSSMILLTGYADKSNAIKAINEIGIYKYIEKPWDNDELIINVKNAYERVHLIEQLQEKNEELKKYSTHLEDIVREKTSNIIEMNERLTAVIDNCADAIIVVSKNGKICEVNPSGQSLFGMSEDIIKNESIENIFETTEIDWERILASEKEKFIREVYALNAVNGNKIPVEISCAYVVEKQEYVFVVRNVKYQKELDRLREDFIAALTHDLRTPSLAAIQTLEYFLNGTLGNLTKKQKMLLTTLKKSQEDMLGLVNTLLEVYKYESGRLKPVKTAFNFEHLVLDCIEQVKSIAQAKNQTIEKTFVNLEDNYVVADRNEIRRVIVNLLGNAVKYTQEGGLIEVKVKVEDNDLHFSVKDNGEGIHKKDIPLLFKRFSQGTQTKRSISTGLGLYLSKQIIDAHEGKIWLESDKGKGSEFFFLLLNSVVNNKSEDNVWVS